MQSLVSLEGYDPQLCEYLRSHQWPEVMEVSYSYPPGYS